MQPEEILIVSWQKQGSCNWENLPGEFQMRWSSKEKKQTLLNGYSESTCCSLMELNTRWKSMSIYKLSGSLLTLWFLLIAVKQTVYLPLVSTKHLLLFLSLL